MCKDLNVLVPRILLKESIFFFAFEMVSNIALRLDLLFISSIYLQICPLPHFPIFTYVSKKISNDNINSYSDSMTFEFHNDDCHL